LSQHPSAKLKEKKLKFDFLFDERKKDEKREGEREKIEI
jgi:hypothetical protein